MELQKIAFLERTELPGLRPPKLRPEGSSGFFEMLSARTAEPVEGMVKAAMPSLQGEPLIPADTVHADRLQEVRAKSEHTVNNQQYDQRDAAGKETEGNAGISRDEDRLKEDPIKEDRLNEKKKDPSAENATAETTGNLAASIEPSLKSKASKVKNATQDEENVRTAFQISGKITGSRKFYNAAGEDAFLPSKNIEERSVHPETAFRRIEPSIQAAALAGTLRRDPVKENVSKASAAKGSHFQPVDREVKDEVSEWSGRLQKEHRKKAAPDSASLKSDLRDQKAGQHFTDASQRTADRTRTDSEISRRQIVRGPAEPGAELKERVILDSDKWNVISRKPARREMPESRNQDSVKGDHQRDFRDVKEPAIRFEAKPLDRPVTAQELETGVRSALNELVKKANVQIGQQGNASAQIRMNPEQLGFMSVDMKVEQNRVVLKILVDREDVLERLKKDLDVLRAEFSKSGLQIESLSLKLRESYEAGNHDNRQDTAGFPFQASDESGRDDTSRNDQNHSGGYFESAFKRAEIETAELLPGAVITPTSGERRQSGYESLLVMNFHQSTDQRSFQA